MFSSLPESKSSGYSKSAIVGGMAVAVVLVLLALFLM
jgi:hypothetical protein